MPDQNEIPAVPPMPAPAPNPAVASPATMLCPQCHQPVSPDEYFCPNCGKRLTEPPLPTNLTAKILLYGFSIALPIICFLAVSYWQGIKYIKSGDPEAQQMGWIALVLMILSTIITFWWAWVGIQQFIQSQTSTAGLSQLL